MVETIRAHRKTTDGEARARAIELLGLVGIARPETRLKAYPHQFSGGMRQRVMIAMALALEPKLLIADEPTTALDVTIQAQVLDLLQHLTEERGTALILITHDLGVVAGMTHRINVMYAGYIVETATTADLFARPSHPYTVGLLHSIPRVDQQADEPLVPIDGRPPDMRRAPAGCPFAARCAWRLERCWVENPALTTLDPGMPLVPTGLGATHRIACHNPPTPEEVATGRPNRPGHRPAPPPAGHVDELATLVDELEDSARFDEYVKSAREAGARLPLGPTAGGLPLPPGDEDTEPWP
jgi:oligopeptide/dipeptide ABC transporter ATP-binding protein